MTIYTHYPQERVYFGEPMAEALLTEVNRLGARRVFVMASASLTASTDFEAQVRGVLGARLVGWACGMPAHTPRDAVLSMTVRAREPSADLIVTLGGGSLTDAGKMVRLALQHDIDSEAGFECFRSIVEADGTRRQPEFAGPTVAQITIPTTLSGGEFNVTAGCTDTKVRVKQSYRHPSMMPVAVILDPEMTRATPSGLWLSTGMRAVDHAVETICSVHGNGQSDGAALNGLRLLVQGLPACATDAANMRARLDCQIGAWQSMEHNQSGVPMGASHGIGHVLGGTCGVPHGATSCVMLPAVLRWNEQVNPERQELVAATMGHSGRDAGDVLEQFVKSLGQPTRLSEVGVYPEQFEEIARHAMHDRYIHTNPRAIRTPAQILEILTLAQ